MKRRDFFKYIARLMTVSPLLTSIFSSCTKTAHAKNNIQTNSRVVIVKRPDVYISHGIVSSEVIFKMLSESICRLTGLQTPEKAWKKLFSPFERIGIKINSLGGKKICTHPELSYAVANHLIQSGIPPQNIIIFDRLTNELKKAGYKINTTGSNIQCFGTDNNYELYPEFSGSIGSCFSQILTRKCDAIISIPVLKDHDLSGVSLNLKGFYGVIHNPNKYHDNGCDPFIADLNSHPHIKNKLRLVIIDGLTGQYNGGPAFKSNYSWPFGGLLLSRDPVAIDTAGAQIIDKQRILKGLPPLKEIDRNPVHIQTAAKRNLGNGDMNKIDIVEI